MKRIYLLVLPALLLSQAAAAQQLRYGLKLGATYAKHTWASNPAAQNASQRLLGASGGLFLRYDLNLSGTISIQPELLYVGKGDQSLRLHYYELPVLARVSLRHFNLPVLAGGRLDLNRVALEAGPQVSSLSTPMHRHLASDGRSRTSFDRSDYAAFQMGYAAGVGYDFTQNLGLTFRYTNDLTGVMRGNGFKGKRNSVFQAQVSYLFGGQQ